MVFFPKDGHICTDIPQVTEQLIPKWPYLDWFSKQNKKYKARQTSNYYSCHRVRPLPSLPDDQLVWVNTRGLKHQDELLSKRGLLDPILLRCLQGQFVATVITCRSDQSPLLPVPVWKKCCVLLKLG